ncbi:MAG TPA: nucleotidyltransferase family protein [Thermoanaerobaculia bacterium]|jgi:hypothetical protein|nr:nucleotidyltransferase family protein [Thermoanaerobaculia bacterium]
MSVASAHELSELILSQAPEIRALGARSLSLFGSFARGEQVSSSDVDLLVEFEPGKKNFDSFMRLAFFLEELLGRPVELLTRESLSRHIGPRILAEARDVPLGP